MRLGQLILHCPVPPAQRSRLIIQAPPPHRGRGVPTPRRPMPPDTSLQQTANALLPLPYTGLRRLARRARWRGSAGRTIQTTALVHVADLKLRGTAAFQDPQHFLRAAAMAMHHILINLARDAMADKRGAGAAQLSLDALEACAAPRASSTGEQGG